MEATTSNKVRVLVMGGLLLLGSMMNVAIAGPVNVNTADATTIAAELKGVGEKTAAAIVAYREEHGPFASVEDLKQVKGVGDGIIENNKENILLSD